MKNRPFTRRAFLRGAAATAATFSIVPRHVLGGPGYKAPSDTLNIAGIGCGGKGYVDLTGCASENIVALCDVDDKQADRIYQMFPRARRYKDFRKMLEAEKDHIDAVTVTTPDHLHAVMSITAMKMGKHVFCQKPLTRTLHEVQQVMDVARETGVVTQMGNQGHAKDGTRQVRELIEAGVIGTVREVWFWTDRPIWPQALERPLEQFHVPAHLDWDLWLGPAPHRPYHPDYYAPFNWRGWWDFGTGALGDIGCHSMDAAFWTLDLRNPSRITAETTPRFLETAPALSRITYEFPATARRDAVKAIWYDGNLQPPKPALLAPDEALPGGGQLFVGDNGLLAADGQANNPRLFPAKLHEEVMADPPPERYPRTEGVYLEWIEACKNGTQPGSNFPDHAGPLTEMVLLGNLAVRSGEVIEWDAQARRVTNVSGPNVFIDEPYRDGWSLT